MTDDVLRAAILAALEANSGLTIEEMVKNLRLYLIQTELELARIDPDKLANAVRKQTRH